MTPAPITIGEPGATTEPEAGPEGPPAAFGRLPDRAPGCVPRLWALAVRLTLAILLEGVCRQLAELPPGPGGRPPGSALLMGLIAVSGVAAWPGLACLGALAILARPPERRWRFGGALAAALAAYAPSFLWFGGPAVALALAGPAHRVEVAVGVVLYHGIAAGMACVLARGTGPWGGPAARRFLTRGGVLYAFAVLLCLRAWRPEIAIAERFPEGLPIAGRGAPGAGGAATPERLSRSLAPSSAVEQAAPPARRLPALPVPWPGTPAMAMLAALVLGTVAALWRSPPGEPARVAVAPPLPADLWPPLLSACGCLALLVADAVCIPPAGGRFQLILAAGHDALLLAVCWMALRELAPLCTAAAVPAIAGAVVALGSAAALATDSIRGGDGTVASIAGSSLAALVLAGTGTIAGLRGVECRQSEWGLALVAGTFLGGFLALTDLTLLRLLTGADHSAGEDLLLLAGVWTKVVATGLVASLSIALPALARSQHGR
jgi:hypothetical protein